VNEPQDPTYLDHNTSTPVVPEVVSVTRAAMDQALGNPSSPHWAGVPAHRMVEIAREQVAGLVGCGAHEVVFTNGGSEINNFALKGLYFASARSRRHIVTTLVEQPTIVAAAGSPSA